MTMNRTRQKKYLLCCRLQALVTLDEAEQISALAALKGTTVSSMLRRLALAELLKNGRAVRKMQQARAAANNASENLGN